MKENETLQSLKKRKKGKRKKEKVKKNRKKILLRIGSLDLNHEAQVPLNWLFKSNWNKNTVLHVNVQIRL